MWMAISINALPFWGDNFLLPIFDWLRSSIVVYEERGIFFTLW